MARIQLPSRWRPPCSIAVGCWPTWDRADDALAAYDGLQSRFGSSESVDLLVLVVRGQVNKARTLVDLQRWDEVLTVCDETWSRFGNHESFRVLQPAWMTMAIKSVALSLQGFSREHLAACEELLNRLDLLDRRAAAGKVADYDAEAVFELRLTIYEIRVLTYIKEGNVPAVTDDVQAILQTLPRLAAMQATSIRS